MTPEEARDRIRAAILRRPDLRYKTEEMQRRFREMDMAREDWQRGLNPYLGFCYVATEAFCALVPEAVPHHCGRQHFWAVLDGTVWDLTADQFPEPYDYAAGHRTRFAQVSARARALLLEAMLWEVPREQVA